MTFTCKECGIPVIVVDGKIIRACKHDGAGVVAGMTAKCTGTGGAKSAPKR